MNRRKYKLLKSEIELTLIPTNVDGLLVPLKYYVDEDFAHIRLRDRTLCANCQKKPCLYFCPAGVFRLDRAGNLMVSFQSCLECGSCRIGCPSHNIDWNLPRGGYGVAYKFG
jgi:ferredoxin like protein